MNSIGRLLRLTTFGESHGTAIGGVLDGFPAGVVVDEEFIRGEMLRRRPGQSAVTTARNEQDMVEFLSGVFEGRTTGTPIAFVIKNDNTRSKDYDNMRDVYRPSHADYVYDCKYGHRDHRGGGRSSARETAVRVCAGAMAKLALKQLGIVVQAYTSQVGGIRLEKGYESYDIPSAETNAVRCPDADKAKAMEELILDVKRQGDTVGGATEGFKILLAAWVGRPRKSLQPLLKKRKSIPRRMWILQKRNRFRCSLTVCIRLRSLLRKATVIRMRPWRPVIFCLPRICRVWQKESWGVRCVFPSIMTGTTFSCGHTLLRMD